MRYRLMPERMWQHDRKSYPFAFIPVNEHGDIYGLDNHEVDEILDDIVTWCMDQFDGVNSLRWLYYQFDFYFRDATDAVAFRLRWC